MKYNISKTQENTARNLTTFKVGLAGYFIVQLQVTISAILMLRNKYFLIDYHIDISPPALLFVALSLLLFVIAGVFRHGIYLAVSAILMLLAKGGLLAQKYSKESIPADFANHSTSLNIALVSTCALALASTGIFIHRVYGNNNGGK